MESHFGYKNLYLFQLLLIINLECVLGLQYPFPISTGRWWLRLLSRAPAEGNTQSKREWGPRRHSRQRGLLPESNGPLSGCPRGRPSLGRWRLNVQPKHDTHTRTHTKIKKKKTNQPPTTQNLETKTPTSILKVKALSPGQRSHSGQQRDEGGLCRVRGSFLPVTSLLLSCPLKKWSGIEVLPPRKKNQIQQNHFQKVLQSKKKQNTCGCRAW